jgi:hypothetical protein
MARLKTWLWNGYVVKKFPDGCLHGAFPAGCGTFEYWCNGKLVFTRRCADNDPETPVWAQHEARCPRHAMERLVS